jgi:hypothetical protein
LVSLRAARPRLPLFQDLPRPLRLDLIETRSFPGGTIITVYQPPGTAG